MYSGIVESYEENQRPPQKKSIEKEISNFLWQAKAEVKKILSEVPKYPNIFPEISSSYGTSDLNRLRLA